jgi:uncharacterized protein (DUF1330 family)
MDNKTTLVVTAVPNPQEMEAVQAYLKGVMPLFQKAGGRLVKRLKVGNTLNGDPTGMVLVMDFESADAVNALFDSEEYAALIPGRDKGFAQMNIHMAGEL